jgi:hypothetical protein
MRLKVPLIPANAGTQIIWRSETLVFLRLAAPALCHLDPGIRRHERV